MKYFVTGATGFVGSAVVQELLGAGHRVVGLARTDSAAAALARLGVEPHRGDVEDLESLRRGAATADGVVHTAFIHDFSRFRDVCEIDRRAILTLGAALSGTTRPLVVSSGTALLSSGPLATEDGRPAEGAHASPRIATEQAVHEVAAGGVRAALVRLPPSVHGEGDHGFVPILFDIARKKRASAYLGDGTNRWPAVHRSDAARLFRLVLERDYAPGSAFHAVAEEGIPFRRIAEVIGARLAVPVVSAEPAHFDWFAHFAALDTPTSSARTRELTGWEPTGPELIADISRPSYFGAP